MNDEHYPPYSMEIQRTIVENLGLKLYDKVSAVVAELIANAYDADADEVTVKLPLGRSLSSKRDEPESGHLIEIIDDGRGMTPDQVNGLYLKVGKNPRPEQGEFTKYKKRSRMGRKGLGKLSPFGICKTIEVRSAGGEKTEKGYFVSHFEMEYGQIINPLESEEVYHPKPLEDDRKYDSKHGTKIILKNFLPKRVPNEETFLRQLAVRFGLSLPDFKITVIDAENPEKQYKIEATNIPLMEGTQIIVDSRPVMAENEEKLEVRGWVGMSKASYKNDELAGIRIYVRNKLAAVTRDFGQPSGFSGEFVARSYLVGEIYAEWLDKSEDLIQTHRQDILWDSEYGRAFSKWGQHLIKEVAKRGREPRRINVREKFIEVSKLKECAHKQFNDAELEKEAIEIGEKIGGFASEEELEDEDYVNGLLEVILTVTPHKLLVDTFKQIKDLETGGKIDFKKLVKLFKTTRTAQIASYGQIVAEKIAAIDTLESAIRKEGASERELQEILEDAPWLINAEWIAITQNQTLDTFQKAFRGWYKKNKKEDVITSTRFAEGTKRPDFIFLDEGRMLIIVEIKPPKHTFNDDDWERLQKYYDATKSFLDENSTFKSDFHSVKIILVRDTEKVSSTISRAMKSVKDEKELEAYTWEDLLRATKIANQSFLRVRVIADPD
jgi:hypothetical protein